jgi:replication factor C large subunit
LHAAWAQKHKPKTLSEIVGNTAAIRKFTDWVKSWDSCIPKKRAAFLYGPPGVGKTVCVEALANELQMEFVEKNASDHRTADAIQRFAGLASHYGTLFGGARLILLDELDGITGTADRGGVRALTEIVKTAQCPVVLTANNAYDPRFRTLRKYCLLIEFKKPTVRDVMKHLRKVCSEEGIDSEEEALKFIAERSGRDVRSAVNDLQALSQGKKKLVYEDVAWLAERDRKDVIFNVLRTVLYSKDSWKAKRAVDTADMDPDMLFHWIYENAPYHLTDHHDLTKAMDALSLADIYRRRIRSTQNWSLLRYVLDFMTAGVAVARERSETSGWIPFRFPQKLQWLSRTKGERKLQSAIGVKIRRKCHISSKRAVKEILPYARIIFESNSEMAAGIAKWLDLDETMIEYLAGNKKQTKAIIAKQS